MTTSAYGESHAKVILIGEHSAVYGKPAIVIPVVNLKVKVTITSTNNNNEIKKTISSKYYSGNITDLPIKLAGLNNLINILVKKLKLESKEFNIKIESNIPTERGLGSSAALASALIKAFFYFTSKPLPNKTLIQLASLEENITHGKSSGIDIVAVNSNLPILIKNKQITNLPYKLNAYLVIANSGKAGSTKEAVNKVKNSLNYNYNSTIKVINHLETTTNKVLITLKNKDIYKLGKLMDNAQTDLKKLEVSTPKINYLIKTANQNGSIGSKLTGSGLGGCVIALVPNKEKAKVVANSLEKAGASNTYIQKI